MATIASKTLAVLEPKYHSDANAVHLSDRTKQVHFHVLEAMHSCTTEFTAIQCHGVADVAGRVVMYQLRNGIDALFIFNNVSKGIALSFRSNRKNLVDFIDLTESETKNLDGSKYAGRLSLKHDCSAKRYEFDGNDAGPYCTATIDDSSILKYNLKAGSDIIGSFVMQPSCLDLSIRDETQTREAFVLLGIAFSIWRLIPCA